MGHEHWYNSGLFWTIFGIAAAIIIGVATIVVPYFLGAARRQIVYGIELATSLLHHVAPVADAELEVSYRKIRVRDPRIIWIRIENRSRRDIRSDDFDNKKPFTL